MRGTKRRGRPPEPLPASDLPVVQRIRELVRLVHGGNLREAALHTGLPYATLRQLYRAETGEPSLSTVARLADAYGLPVDWFLGRGSGSGEPQMGWEGILPADPETGSERRYARRVLIPFGAWPLAGLALGLERRLAGLPAASTRPIVGAAHDDFELRRRLTAFLLQPLLAARAAGSPVPLPADPPMREEPPFTAARRELWLQTLRKLGEWWEVVRILP